MLKWIIGIVVIALAVAALWWSGWLGKMTPSQNATSTPQTQTPEVQAPTNGMSASNDASDAAIVQDTAAIDAQMTGLTQDSANIDTSLNDKSVQ